VFSVHCEAQPMPVGRISSTDLYRKSLQSVCVIEKGCSLCDTRRQAACRGGGRGRQTRRAGRCHLGGRCNACRTPFAMVGRRCWRRQACEEGRSSLVRRASPGQVAVARRRHRGVACRGRCTERRHARTRHRTASRAFRALSCLRDSGCSMEVDGRCRQSPKAAPGKFEAERFTATAQN
jgi:hypothetical protein